MKRIILGTTLIILAGAINLLAQAPEMQVEINTDKAGILQRLPPEIRNEVQQIQIPQADIENKMQAVANRAIQNQPIVLSPDVLKIQYKAQIDIQGARYILSSDSPNNPNPFAVASIYKATGGTNSAKIILTIANNNDPIGTQYFVDFSAQTSTLTVESSGRTTSVPVTSNRHAYFTLTQDIGDDVVATISDTSAANWFFYSCEIYKIPPTR